MGNWHKVVLKSAANLDMAFVVKFYFDPAIHTCDTRENSRLDFCKIFSSFVISSIIKMLHSTPSCGL